MPKHIKFNSTIRILLVIKYTLFQKFKENYVWGKTKNVIYKNKRNAELQSRLHQIILFRHDSRLN